MKSMDDNTHGTNAPSQPAPTRNARGEGGGFLPVFCNVLGTLMLLVAVGLFATLVAPTFAGYQVVDVTSNSMRPELPVGSAAYVKEADLTQIQVGEAIAYHDSESVVVHRVVENRVTSEEFATRGDANVADDPEPIPYTAVIGRMEFHVPIIGALAAIFESVIGKLYLLLTAACGIMLNVVAVRMRDSRQRKALERARAEARAREASSQLAGHVQASGGSRESVSYDSGYARPARQRGSILRGALATVLAVAFIGSAGVIVYVNWQYSVSDSLYEDASNKYREDNGASTGNGINEVAPIKIDFDSLCAANPDVIGWIYCPDTVINYPVLHGKTNDDYINRDYTGGYNIDGSIFVDCDNAGDFSDSNSIIYGHHMNSGSMFATLENWSNQSYYEAHPVMWLLTPTRDYKIELFSSHHANAYSTMYHTIKKPGEELAAVLGEALVESELHANAELDSTLSRLAKKKGVEVDKIQVNENEPFVLVDADSSYVMLSTCAYLFDNDRYVLHGKLVPLASAGGVAKNV